LYRYAEGVRNNPDSFNSEQINQEKLCSDECIELVNSNHCKAMNLDTSINSPVRVGYHSSRRVIVLHW
jgi:hypothetical protein